MVDTLGLVWQVAVTAASVQDRQGFALVLGPMEAHAGRLEVVFADGSYAGNWEGLLPDLLGWRLEVVRKAEGQVGFAVLPKRWIVERTFAWLVQWRRLRCDYEHHTHSSEAMVKWASVLRMARLLAKKPAPE